MDGFRKRDSNGRIMQLNIYGTIIKDSISKRWGRLFYYEYGPRMEEQLNETEIDSIARSWNLKYLVKE